MRYRISLCLCAGIILGLGAALFGPSPAGLASDQEKGAAVNKASAGAMCRTVLSHHLSSPSAVSYWLMGRADLVSNAWIENWTQQFGLVRDRNAFAAAVPNRSVAGPQQPQAVTVDVTVGPSNQLVFQPAVVTINVGDTVRWTFGSAGHDLNSGSSCIPDNGFCWPNNANCGNNGSATAGTVYTHTFNTAGNFPYFCGPHCFSNMTGTVVVQGNPTPTPTPTATPTPTPTPTSNPIDQPDFFVKQHYTDFLNRQADQSGLAFWTNQMTNCGATDLTVCRVNVSGAFFVSIEFQQTGNLVYKMYKAAFGNLSGAPVAAVRAPFLTDTRQIQSTPTQVVVGQGDWQAQLEANKQAFAMAFVQRAQFQTMYASMNASTYVQTLFNNTGVTPTAAETTAATNAFNSAGSGDAGRAAALRSVAESNSVSTKLFNEAFVLMQYFGYLQRNPNDPPDSDYSGFNFWLAKLNQFNGDYIGAEMVKAFISSTEYRRRFGPP